MKVLRISHSAVVGAWRERERELIRRGHQVTLLSAKAWDEGGQLVDLEAGSDSFVTGVRTFGRHPNLFLYAPFPIWHALGRGWDVVDIHEEPYALATAEVLLIKLLRRCNAPYLLYSAQNIDKKFPLPFRWLERATLRHAAGLSVCNSEAGRIARRKGLRGRAELIGLGVNTDEFAPAVASSASEVAQPGERSSVRVGYVGRLASHKGVAVLLDAVSLEPRLTLTLIGSGPAEKALIAQAERLGIQGRVSFRGHLDQSQLPGVYQQFDVLAVPSLPTPGWLEQFCRVAVEAMATGVIVVASDSGALPDVVGDCGLLVSPGDPEALAAALLRAGLDEGLRARMRRAGLARAQEFSWQQVGAAYSDLYEQVAGLGLTRPAQFNDRAVHVIVVAYGSPVELAAALAPLSGRFPITVVDNSSMDAVRDVAESAGATYIDSGANLGFGSGVNIALGRRDLRADILLLNPDASISPHDVDLLHETLLADPRLAAVGPSQTDDLGVSAKVLWPFPSPARAWREAVGFGNSAKGEYVIGSVLLMRSEALGDIGAFDERFFLYSEETDWEYRAFLAGWRMALVPAVVARHTGAGTSNDPGRREIHFHASQEHYARKHFGAIGWQVQRMAVLSGGLARSAALRGDRRREAWARVRLYATGPARLERKVLPRKASR